MTKLSLIGKLYEEHISTLTKEQPILKKVYSKLYLILINNSQKYFNNNNPKS